MTVALNLFTIFAVHWVAVGVNQQGLKDTAVEERVHTMMAHTGGVWLKLWLIEVSSFLLESVIFVSFVAGQRQMNNPHIMPALRHDFGEPPLQPIHTGKSGYLVNNKGCRIAALDPFDAVNLQYMQAKDPINCRDSSKGPLIESNDTAVYVNPKARHNYYNVSERANCCWAPVSRTKGQDNKIEVSPTCKPFEDSVIVDAEFVAVQCFRGQKQIYRDYHAFIPLKEATEKRCKDAESANREKLSLLILGLDTISRQNFHRMMPMTVATLEKLGAIELLGYHKVGENTYPNLVPLLTGLSLDELRATYGPNQTVPHDNCPFIWKNFSQLGYRTIMIEDRYEISTFNYLRSGFRDPPTDYYARPYVLANEMNIANPYEIVKSMCVGVRKNFETLLDYAGKAVEKFVKYRYFAFIWQNSLSHEDFNHPKLGDDVYSQFIQRLVNDKLLNNTLLIVMSDHGSRWGAYRQTHQGRMEDSLPFVFFLFPDWWKHVYPVALSNLRNNMFRLTTPFDLHETMFDVLKMEDMKEDGILKRSARIHAGDVPRGISLFSEIPDDRTCAMAGIPEQFCVCHTTEDISVDDPRLAYVMDYLMAELNDRVKNFPQCSPMKLRKLTSAKKWINLEAESTGDNAWQDYTITFETEPGNALFEASMKHDGPSSQILGTINRVNAYGNQSACVNDATMRLYCYCL